MRHGHVLAQGDLGSALLKTLPSTAGGPSGATPALGRDLRRRRSCRRAARQRCRQGRDCSEQAHAGGAPGLEVAVEAAIIRRRDEVDQQLAVFRSRHVQGAKRGRPVGDRVVCSEIPRGGAPRRRTDLQYHGRGAQVGREGHVSGAGDGAGTVAQQAAVNRPRPGAGNHDRGPGRFACRPRCSNGRFPSSRRG